MMSFKDFVYIYRLENKAKSNLKIQQVFSSLALKEVENYLTDGTFESNTGIVSLHPSKGTHWVCYINENYFDSYDAVSLGIF